MNLRISKQLQAVFSLTTVIFVGLFNSAQSLAEKNQQDDLLADDFITLADRPGSREENAAIRHIRKNWDKSHIAMALEVLRFAPTSADYARLDGLIRRKIGGRFEEENKTVHDYYHWLWNKDIEPSPDYANFKAELYKRIDPRFATYFLDRQESARIRLDEIVWGGVVQDGIPPLRNPEMIAANDADYLEDDHIVFGIVMNGDARAYPKRILAWHEMFTDTIGGVDIAGVYCTLCGTVIPYRTELDGKKYTLGTSGFLYRSNKLMYDKATQSLWSTEKGEPVLGPLVDKGIKLAFESVVTTTWGEWKRRHPDTTVLSLNTGHRRDYGEGVAYADYFANHRLMFHTPFKDRRLRNKQEVLALRFAGAPNQQLAIDTRFLNKNPLYKNAIGAQQFVVLTDETGANRVYDPGDVNLVSYDQDVTVTDASGGKWTLNEERLSHPDGRVLFRLPYHRAFWFGWHAAYPETRLIK